MEVVYISGPYTLDEPEETRVEKAKKEAERWWKLGYAVICPRLNTGDLRPLFYNSFMGGYYELLERSDLVVALDGWGGSPEGCGELGQAFSLGKVVVEKKGGKYKVMNHKIGTPTGLIGDWYLPAAYDFHSLDNF